MRYTAPVSCIKACYLCTRVTCHPLSSNSENTVNCAKGLSVCTAVRSEFVVCFASFSFANARSRGNQSELRPTSWPGPTAPRIEIYPTSKLSSGLVVVGVPSGCAAHEQAARSTDIPLRRQLGLVEKRDPHVRKPETMFSPQTVNAARRNLCSSAKLFSVLGGVSRPQHVVRRWCLELSCRLTLTGEAEQALDDHLA